MAETETLEQWRDLALRMTELNQSFAIELKEWMELATTRNSDEVERLRSVLRMWVKFWENDESIDIKDDQWLAEEAMEETRKVLGVDIKQ